jgi:hypothetical protein
MYGTQPTLILYIRLITDVDDSKHDDDDMCTFSVVVLTIVVLLLHTHIYAYVIHYAIAGILIQKMVY